MSAPLWADSSNDLLDKAREAWSAGYTSEAEKMVGNWYMNLRKIISSQSFQNNEMAATREAASRLGLDEMLSEKNLSFLENIVRGGSINDYLLESYFHILDRLGYEKRKEEISLLLKAKFGPQNTHSQREAIIADPETFRKELLSYTRYTQYGTNFKYLENNAYANYHRADPYFRNFVDKFVMISQFIDKLSLTDEEFMLMFGLTKGEIHEFLATANALVQQENIKDLENFIQRIKDTAEQRKKEAREKINCAHQDDQIQKLKKDLEEVSVFITDKDDALASFSLFADFDRNGRVDENDLNLLKQGYHFGNMMIVLQQLESLQQELDWINDIKNRKEIVKADLEKGKKDILLERETLLQDEIEEKRKEFSDYEKITMRSVNRKGSDLKWINVAQDLAFADLNRDFRFNDEDIKEMEKIVTLWKQLPPEKTFINGKDVSNFISSLSEEEKQKFKLVLRRSHGEEFMILLAERKKIEAYRREQKNISNKFDPLEYPWIDLMTGINRKLQK